MSTEQQAETAIQKKPQPSIKAFFSSDNVKAKFAELLGKKAPGFITSVLQVVNSNTLLQKADHGSIYNAAAMAATLDLPVVSGLGFAWIVPYSGRAQFQIGWRGFVQLAQRTAQYEHINVLPVRQSQFKKWHPLDEVLDADFDLEDDSDVVGYVAKFTLLSGFKKTVYWKKEKVQAHAKRYSKSYSSGPWVTHFDDMAMKTVLKNTLSKWGPMSIELQRAMEADQAVIEDLDTDQFSYVDNNTEEPAPQESPVVTRAKFMLDDLKTRKEVVAFMAKLDMNEFNKEEWITVETYATSLDVK